MPTRRRLRRVPHIAAFTHDPGSANAVGAVVRQLRGAGARVELYAKGPAQQRLALAGITHHQVDADFLPSQAAGEAELVLAGTAQFDDLEQRAIAVAASLGIASLVVSDFWGNQEARFRSRIAGDEGRMPLPDYVTALDEECAAELIAVGFAPAQVLISGQPHFGALLERAIERAPAEPGPLQRVLFASQPMPGEPEALELVAAVVAQRAGCSLTLRLHPRAGNREQLLESMRRAGAGERISSQPTLAADMDEHDVLIGMNSAVLIEAAAAGGLVARIARAEYSFPAQLDELIPPLRSERELLAYLEEPFGTRRIPEEFARQHIGADRRITRAALAVVLLARRAHQRSDAG